MPQPADNKLVRVLRAPAELAGLAPPEWYPLLLHARRAGLLGVLAVRAEEAGVLGCLPERARQALQSGRLEAAERERMLAWETGRIRRALLDCRAPAILLKGAAYAALGLPISRGRLTGDVDILVHRSSLQAVESCLEAHGWSSTIEDSYDQRYYRRYMHELPPLRHELRGTVVDVHHTITPPTSRIRIDGEMLWPDARPIGMPGLLTLAPADMVLHAAIHLFHEGNPAGGLRDLLDIDGLLRHFGGDAGFWDDLVRRADEFSAKRILGYALRYARLVFATPIPEVMQRQAVRWEPPAPLQWAMDGLFLAALLSPTVEGRLGTRFASLTLYVRSHWRRMPPALLAGHLLRKAVARRSEA